MLGRKLVKAAFRSYLAASMFSRLINRFLLLARASARQLSRLNAVWASRPSDKASNPMRQNDFFIKILSFFSFIAGVCILVIFR